MAWSSYWSDKKGGYWPGSADSKQKRKLGFEKLQFAEEMGFRLLGAQFSQAKAYSGFSIPYYPFILIPRQFR